MNEWLNEWMNMNEWMNEMDDWIIIFFRVAS